MKGHIATSAILLVCAFGPARVSGQSTPASGPAAGKVLRIDQDEQTRAIRVYREGGKEPILTQNAISDNRPYLHPMVAPDGKGLLTEYRPSHHLHQTGIFWGFKLVNGRDFFMKWQAENYRRVSANVIQQNGRQVKWQTVYDMLDENGNTVMTETQNWAMADSGDRYVLDLEWRGEAKTDITLAKYYVGGLFVRIPWQTGSRAEAVNALGQRDKETEQQRATWMDVGIQVEGRDDLAHIVVFDHPDNHGFPIPWRVDGQMGFGPNSEWAERRIQKGQIEIVRHRLIAYTGDLDPAAMTRAWKEFARQK